MGIQRVYSRDHVEQAARAYAITGSLRASAKATGVHEKTIGDWHRGIGDRGSMFLELVSSIRLERQTEFIGQYENAVERALSLVNERLADDRTTAKDAMWIAGVAQDKALLLQGKATSITRRESVADLAQQFQALAQQHRGQIVDQSDSPTDGDDSPAQD